MNIVYSEYNKVYKEEENNTNYEIMFLFFAFLVEWKYLLQFNKKCSNINWVNGGNFGAISNEKNELIKTKDLIKNLDKEYICDNYELLLTIKWCLKTREKYNKYNELAHLVACTYPFHVSNKGDRLDLVNNVIDYKINYKIKYTDMLEDLQNRKV